MQVLKSLISCFQPACPEVQPLSRPMALPVESLGLVGGGLPRVGGLGGNGLVVDEEPPRAEALPPVS